MFYVDSLNLPWAKCGLFAAAALSPIFCGLIAAFCPLNLAIMVYLLVDSYVASCHMSGVNEDYVR